MSGGIGISYDNVELKLGGDLVLVAESYEIQASVFQVPAAFALKLGHSDALKTLISKAPPNTPFELSVDGKTQFVGTTDGFSASGGSGGSSLTIRGRDRLAVLHDACIRSERSFSDITYADLVKAGLDDVLKGKDYVLSFSNDANRKAVTGAPKQTANHSAERLGTTEVFFWGLSTDTAGLVPETGRVGTTQTYVLTSAGSATGVNNGAAGIDDSQKQEPVAAPNGGGQKTIQAKIEQRWYDGVIKPELDRAGLFLWCSADGSFVLSAPDVKQDPTYRIIRKRGLLTRDVIITAYDLRHETTPRHSSFEVHMRRGGGGKDTRTKGFQVVVDGEMVALGYDRPLCFKDEKCKTIAQAEFLARRRMCETRRRGWSLVYTVSGHSTIGIDGTRVVWCQDTLVEVEDEELGIRGTFYVSDVELSANPHKQTKIHLMRPSDLVFGELQ